jgi:hypothetical protein
MTRDLPDPWSPGSRVVADRPPNTAAAVTDQPCPRRVPGLRRCPTAVHGSAVSKTESSTARFTTRPLETEPRLGRCGRDGYGDTGPSRVHPRPESPRPPATWPPISVAAQYRHEKRFTTSYLDETYRQTKHTAGAVKHSEHWPDDASRTHLLSETRRFPSFVEQRTPGYYNHEGKLGQQGEGLVTNSYGEDPSKFFRLTAEWRSVGDFASPDMGR